MAGKSMIIATDSFQTIAVPCEAELKEKGSRFIAYAAPISQREESEQIIERIRKKFFDATHHCFAHRIGVGADEATRVNDDGEPSGSAGKPIMAVIQGRELTNIVVVVTRYFGGTKLGIGGLVRAYGGVTAQLFNNAQIITGFLMTDVSVECSYHQLSAILKTIEHYGAVIKNSSYKETVKLSVVIRRRNAESFVQSVIESTSGQVQPKIEPLG
jgi:uncharacterized YigZ family protein